LFKLYVNYVDSTWIIAELLIESFLVNRSKMVRINGFTSFWREVLSGIPKRSILEPLLVIVFINDLVDNCDNGSDVFL